MPINLSFIFINRKAFVLSFTMFVWNLVGEVDFYPNLRVGSKDFQNVQVISSNDSSLSIRHSRGISQVRLAELDPDLQLKYGYDSTKDKERSRRLANAQQQVVANEQARIEHLKVVSAQKRSPIQNENESPELLKDAFASFGEKPELRSEVDMREAFRKHSLSVRNQGIRPSCSIHSIVAALEYQYAVFENSSVNISEDYLLEATAKSVGRSDIDASATDDNNEIPPDVGFALEDVFQAIRGYGLAFEESVDGEESEISKQRLENVVFSPYRIPGGRTNQCIQNIIHVLNSDMPVVVGMAWPSRSRISRTSLLSKQPPVEGVGHAVTFVGYRCSNEDIESTKFIFRNSWGPRWGAGGYGFVTYEYLINNMQSSYVVELR